MDRSTPSEKRYDYRELVELITQGIPTFEPLHKFLLDANDNLPCEITLLEFEESQGHEPQVSEGRQETTKKIKSQNIDPKCQEELLVNVLQRTDGHQLLLVENLTPTVTSLLGTYWNVPPDFFLAHLENSNWYNMQNIPQNLPGLSSVQSLDGFVRFQFIGPREIEIKDSPGLQPRDIFTGDNLLDDRIHEDPATASVQRVAGGFTPFAPPSIDPEDGPNTKINPVAFVRNSVTIWFDRDGDKWRKGIVLFDPPFVAKNPRFRNKKDSNYRSFLRRRAPPHFSAKDIDNRKSYKDSFEKCLQKNQHVKAAGVPKPFVLLEDLCRIIASEWLLFNTYIERELNNIEAWFEMRGEQYDQKKLQDLLQHLMRARRRVTKYDTLVSDQLHLCPAHWKQDSSHNDYSAKSSGSCPMAQSSSRPMTQSSSCPMAQSSTSARFSSPLLDFHQVSDHLAHNKIRIVQAIKIVTSLMAVHLNNLVVEQNRTLLHHNDLTSRQNKLSEARNSSLAFLTGVTSFLLPFTTVAAFMAIPPDSGLGPGSKGQWIYWVSAGVLALTLMLAFGLDFVYEKWKVYHKTEKEQVELDYGNRHSTSKEECVYAMPEKKMVSLEAAGSTILSQMLRRGASKKKLDVPGA